ncbi:UbiH/UbiF family hydroxylase [Aromatoleum toluclasticum]|uniref:UbiH/UbiF family hydroxylase n=1 Tax=Aromatoleum toluclasticum TaxID=92003 RepID=UPI001D195370|nr:UbiH/UbiF family hydroxylase [Aromatoleum toluclasticum]MCC4114999.1 UbiH/UbiF family hydroxylase [Aromatoleum toluclasticum]
MDFDLIIVGGGLAGASLAAALQGTRYRIALVEARAPAFVEGWDSRVYAISPSCANFLRDIGIWQHLDPGRIAAVHSMSIRGDAGGELEFSSYDSGLSELAWIVESGRMQRELWETVKRQHNVTMLVGGTPEAITVDRGSVSLTLPGRKPIFGRLVVGADGVNSWVREQAGIDAEISPYGERGVVANFNCEKDHCNRAFQWFRDDGILALLPLPGRMVSMVWSCADDFADSLLALESGALCRRVADAAGGALGALDLITPAQAFPLRFMRVASVVKERIALVGDAAHAIHPLSGHGINLGFQDARALADVLRKLPAWRDPGEIAVLRGYARARAEEPFLVQYATHGLNRLFGSRNPLLAAVRNAGLNLTGRLPVVRNALVRYAVSGRF